MASPTTVAFEDFIVKLGNGATPEIFSAPCALTSRGFDRSADTKDTSVPDCDDESVAPWMRRRIMTRSAQISGEGVLSLADRSVWDAFYNGATPKNCRIEIDAPGAQGGGYYQGQFVLTAYNLAVADKDIATINVTLVSAGDITWTANA